MANSAFLAAMMKCSERVRSAIIKDLIERALKNTKTDRSLGRSGNVQICLGNTRLEARVSITLFDRAVARRLITGLDIGDANVVASNVLHNNGAGHELGHDCLFCELRGRVVMVAFDSDVGDWTEILVQKTFNLEDGLDVQKFYVSYNNASSGVRH